jgi:hypothetical protein
MVCVTVSWEPDRGRFVWTAAITEDLPVQVIRLDGRADTFEDAMADASLAVMQEFAVLNDAEPT